MNTTTPEAPESNAAAAPSPVQLARKMLKELQTEFAAFRDVLPLAIGIDKQLVAQKPDLNKKIMRIALGLHTKSPRYLQAMAKATTRFNLDGSASNKEVSDEHRSHATDILKQRSEREEELRKARRAAFKKEAIAKRKAAEVEESDRKRADKLQQLAAKFSKR
jgi:ProP effector